MEGFCWSLINGTRSENDLKFRLSSVGVNDVGGMSLHSKSPLIPDYYIVCLCNSYLMSRYSETFINFTVNFQINDARILPIIVPTPTQLRNFSLLFRSALTIKKLHKPEEEELELMHELDSLVNKLYLIY